MKVLLHIGSPKAGSTTIQEALKLNRETLAAHDILAWEPDASRGSAARTLANRFASPLRPLLPRERTFFNTREETIDWSLQNWRVMSDLVRKRKPALTMLSSESIFAVSKVGDVVEALRETFSDITIIAYVRDPAEQYRSAIDQIIRDGARFQDLPLPTEFHFPSHTVIRQYHDLLGKDRVIVRNFDRRNLADGDLVTDFFAQLSRVAGTGIGDMEAPPRANESLSAAATVWLLSMNETFERFSTSNDREQVKRRLVTVRRLIRSKALADLPKLSLGDTPIGDWARLTERAAIEYFNATFFQDQFPLEPAPATSELPAPKTMRRIMYKWLIKQADAKYLPLVLREVIR